MKPSKSAINVDSLRKAVEISCLRQTSSPDARDKRLPLCFLVFKSKLQFHVQNYADEILMIALNVSLKFCNINKKQNKYNTIVYNKIVNWFSIDVHNLFFSINYLLKK